MKAELAGLGTVLKKTFKGWNEDDPFRQSSVIAYYAIFSLPALLVLIINVAGFFFGKDTVSNEISTQIEGVMGRQTAEQVGEIVDKAGNAKTGVIAGIIAVITIITGALGVFIELQKSLNNIWDVKQKELKGKKGIIYALKTRLFSFGLVLSIGFLLLMSLAISSMLAAMSHWLEAVFSEAVAYVFYVLEFVVSLTVISTLFTLMFKFLPDVKIKWKDAFTGGALTGLLFIIGKYALSLYFGKAHPDSAYGAAGSIILILLWSSYSSMIVFFGAEFTRQFMTYHGREITPTPVAEKVGKVNPVSGQPIKTEHGQQDNYNTLLPARYEKHYPIEIKDHEKNTEAMKKNIRNPRVMKSKKEVDEEIDRLERKLEHDKKDIKDDLRFSHLILGLVPRFLKPENKTEKITDIDKYIRKVAKDNITQSEHTTKGWVDKILETLHLKKDGK